MLSGNRKSFTISLFPVFPVSPAPLPAVDSCAPQNWENERNIGFMYREHLTKSASILKVSQESVLLNGFGAGAGEIYSSLFFPVLCTAGTGNWFAFKTNVGRLKLKNHWDNRGSEKAAPQDCMVNVSSKKLVQVFRG
ncbi:hypothetical protein NC651_026809 [Populus alba x Populus x berolinensis]|nr:hypothetical protein NC651_026809 [Populus alba x Populus x berolinensis]